MYRWRSWYGFGLGTLVAAMVVISSVYGFGYFTNPQRQSGSIAASSPPLVTITTPTATSPPQPMSTPNIANPPTKYGHFSYPELNRNRLIVVGSYGQKEYQRQVEMEREAGLALFQLINAARDRGLWIIPISGFRTIEYQANLFNRQVQRQGSEIAAARISAPPGYSEHHTGLAIDLGDGSAAGEGIPDITEQFGQTRVYEWLQNNAMTYGFELSYPPNNAQGVMYEPWHWRYVGSPAAQQVFAPARQGARG
jgi:D-alanyl-D-alanine carboxypeptidase